MPPKIDPTEVKFLTIKVFGGEAGPAATLAPKLGPMGLNAKKVGDDIIKESSKVKGIRCMIQLRVQNRNAEISILPTSAALIIKELGEAPRDRKKVKNVQHKGNITFEQIKKIAKTMEDKSLSKSFSGTVKQILGTAQSIGCTVDGKHPKETINAIRAGEIVC